MVIFSVLITLVLMEIGLRTLKAAGVAPNFFSNLGYPNAPIDVRDGPGMYYVHPYSAYNMKPGYTSGPGQKINSLGFRGEEVTLEKPPSTYRIVALGGSTTFGVYVDWNETYPYYLQRDLQKRLGTEKIEVINAGLSGSTSAESLHRLFYQILPLKPDMVVFYEGYNDLLPRVFSNYQKDYFHFRRSNSHNPPGLTQFELYRLLLRTLNHNAFIELNNLASMVWKKENLSNEDNVRLATFYATSSSEYEQNMEYIVTTLIANGVQPVLATFPFKPDIAHWNDYVPAFAWEEGMRQNNAAMRRVAEKFALPLVPFAEQAADLPAMNIWTWQVNRHDGCCYTDSIHMSAKGDIIQASIFADTIEPIVRQAMDKNN